MWGVSAWVLCPQIQNVGNKALFQASGHASFCGRYFTLLKTQAGTHLQQGLADSPLESSGPFPKALSIPAARGPPSPDVGLTLSSSQRFTFSPDLLTSDHCVPALPVLVFPGKDSPLPSQRGPNLLL